MISLTSRGQSILLILLRSFSPIPVAQIAGRLDLSPRMVRRSLHEVTEWLKDRHVHIRRTPGIGVALEISDELRESLEHDVEQLSSVAPLLTARERRGALIFQLLQNEQPVIVLGLQLRLNVSRLTAMKDLDIAGEWFRQHRLKLIRRQNSGCWVEGSEVDRREAIVSFLIEEIGSARLLRLLNNWRTSKPRQPQVLLFLDAAVGEFLTGLEIESARSFVKALGDVTGAQYSDEAIVQLILYTAIMIDRLQCDHRITIAPEQETEIRRRPQYELASRLSRLVEKRFYLHPGDAETACLALQLLCAEVSRRDLQTRDTDDFGIPEPKLRRALQEVLEHAAAYLHPSLLVDQQLWETLVDQLSQQLDLLQLGTWVRNPLTAEIRKDFPYVYGIASDSRQPLEQLAGRTLPEDLIGTVAVCLIAAMGRLNLLRRDRQRILVVCHAGVATSWLLVSRIRAELSEVDVVDVLSTVDLQRKYVRMDNIDLVVSTVPVEIRYVPSIVVSPLLNPADLRRLRKALSVISTAPGQARAFPSLSPSPDLHLTDLLRTSTIAVKVKATNWPDVVEQAGALLLAQGSVENDFVVAMKELIDRYGPYMVLLPGVVLLHADPKSGVRNVCMSLITLDEGVNFGNIENDPVDVAFALGAVDDHSHLQALRELQQVFKDPHAISAIRRATNKGEIVNLLRRFSP